jgi:hypothetical protein
MSSGGTAAGSLAVPRRQPDAKRPNSIALIQTFPAEWAGLPGVCLPDLPYQPAGSAVLVSRVSVRSGSVRLRPSNNDGSVSLVRLWSEVDT